MVLGREPLPLPKATKELRLKPMRGSLSEHAYQSIRRLILRGALPPGSSIPRRQLAAKLGVSFLPVSEALQRLEHEGLVESIPRIGTRVKVPTLQDVRGNYVIREALESQSARLYAEKASADERREMVHRARKIDELQPDFELDLFDFFSLHDRFHHRIAECAGCPGLCVALEKTNTLLHTWQYAALADFREMPAHYHEDLIAVLNDGDPEAADRAMRAHVRHGMDEVMRRMADYLDRLRHAGDQFHSLALER
jgi:DNA-binding GntR family transcriptional regulator